ncbi:GAF domain-containing protein [Nocardia sp. NPDC020380]|uniref:GAF domain-containing protein n=1 Tax=Nocardia sp. NPDC020380 TaxID=3364309 RepID=UPI0037A755BA
MWFLIDAAEPAAVIRYVPEDGTARSRSLHRALRPTSLATLAGSAVATTLSSNAPCEREVPVRGERYRVSTRPLPGPDGATLGVLLWAGSGDAPMTEPPAVDAFLWDGRQWTLRNHGDGGAVLPAGFPLLHGAWFLSRIAECEERDRLITAALNGQPGTRWSGPMRVLTADDKKTTRVFGFFAHHAEHTLRGLLLCVGEDHEPGIVQPTYHADAAVALLGGTTALIDTVTMQIIDWLTPPLAGIAWRHHPVARGTEPTGSREFNLTTTHLIHPDDMKFYLQVMLDFREQRIKTARAIVRLLRVDRSWQPVELYTRPLPNADPRFVITLFRPVDEGSEPGMLSP